MSDELDRIRAGADPKPVDMAVPLTSGQLWHKLLEADPERRARMLDAFRAQLDTAYRCFAADHERRIDELEKRLGVAEMNRAVS